MSNFIVEYLTEYFKKDKTESLSPEHQGVARSFLKMAEESTAWYGQDLTRPFVVYSPTSRIHRVISLGSRVK